jgi:signal transduction histidine kinase
VTVLADSLLRQLFYNLIDDSLKYGEKVGQIRVHCRESSEGKLEIVYEDDGVGVPETVRSNLFKEGYGKGTGYGLFLIRRICEVYGWTIRETGKQGQGAQFTMTTPPREDQTRAAQPSPIVTTA